MFHWYPQLGVCISCQDAVGELDLCLWRPVYAGVCQADHLARHTHCGKITQLDICEQNVSLSTAACVPLTSLNKIPYWIGIAKQDAYFKQECVDQLATIQDALTSRVLA